MLLLRRKIWTQVYTQGRMPCEDKGRYQGDAAKFKECQRLQETTRCLERSMEHIYPLRPLEENNCPSTLVFLSFSLQSCKTNFYCWSDLVCDTFYPNPRKPIQILFEHIYLLFLAVLVWYALVLFSLYFSFFVCLFASFSKYFVSLGTHIVSKVCCECCFDFQKFSLSVFISFPQCIEYGNSSREKLRDFEAHQLFSLSL